MNSLVCDKCGIKAGNCHHRWDKDYNVEPRADYEAYNSLIKRWMLGAIIALAAALMWIFKGVI